MPNYLCSAENILFIAKIFTDVISLGSCHSLIASDLKHCVRNEIGSKWTTFVS